MSHTRIFQWADVPEEWAEQAEAMEPRDWLAVVAGNAFEIHWTDQVRYQATPDTLLVAGNEPDWGRARRLEVSLSPTSDIGRLTAGTLSEGGNI